MASAWSSPAEPMWANRSLLNRLLGEKRAIVAASPGTTRDFIEETVNIPDIPVRLTDTAGIRTDAVEQEGIAMVWQRIDAADAVLLVFDGSENLTAADRHFAAKLAGKALIPLVNKADLPRMLAPEALSDLLPEPSGDLDIGKTRNRDR